MNQHLVALDFDGTIAATFEPSPNGMDVSIASKLAIGKKYGSRGLEVYDQIGGLGGREPGELIALMHLRLGINPATRDDTELYVSEKLASITPEISPTWPRLLPGVGNFFRDVSDRRIPVDLSIISSGHNKFIERVFEVNGIDVPHNLVTSDELRQRPMPLERPRFKPHTFQLAQAHRNWDQEIADEFTSLSGLSVNFHDIPSEHRERSHHKPYMLYVGDDYIKDGGLAWNGRIPFVFIPPANSNYTPNCDRGQIMVSDFNDLRTILRFGREGIENGESFSEIILGKPDAELFPPLDPEARPFAKWMEKRRAGVGPERF